MNLAERSRSLSVNRRWLLVAPMIGVIAVRDGAFAQGHALEPTPVASPVAARWTIADLEAAGLTGPNSYQSPLYGYTVEWPGSWTLDASGVLPVRSDPDWGETGRDDLFLVPADPAVEARLLFTSRPDDGVAIGDRLDANPLPGTGGVRLLIRARPTQITWVDLLFEDMTTTVVSVTVNQVISLNGGADLFIAFTAGVEGVGVAFTTAQEILLHGEPLFNTVDWQDISDGLGRWS